MLQNLKLLLSLRSWLKSRTLNFAAVLGLLATLDLASPVPVVQVVLDFMTSTFHIMDTTAVAWLLVLKSVADAMLRAKTDIGLQHK